MDESKPEGTRIFVFGANSDKAALPDIQLVPSEQVSRAASYLLNGLNRLNTTGPKARDDGSASRAALPGVGEATIWHPDHIWR